MMNRRKNKCGFYVLILLVLLSILSLFCVNQNAYEMGINTKLSPPSFSAFFGTDSLGRDIFSRTIIGIRYSLFFSILSLVGSSLIGIFLGLLCVRVPKWLDQTIIRLTDTINSIPPILTALVLISIFNKGNISLIVSLIVVFIPTFVRITRNKAMEISELEYIQRADTMGAENWRIMFIHILPNMKKNIITTSVIVLTNSIILEAALSYLGDGIQPPTPSLGRLLYDGQPILLNAPWATIFPGLCIIVIILCFNSIEKYFEETI